MEKVLPTFDEEGRVLSPTPMSPKIQFEACMHQYGNTAEGIKGCIVAVIDDLILAEKLAQFQYKELEEIEIKQTGKVTRDTKEIYSDEVDHEKKLSRFRTKVFQAPF
jgi:ferritin-like protein